MARLAHALRISCAERARKQNPETATRVAVQPPADPAVVLVGEDANSDVVDKIRFRTTNGQQQSQHHHNSRNQVEVRINATIMNNKHFMNLSNATNYPLHPAKNIYRDQPFLPSPSHPPPRPVEILAASSAGGIFLVRDPPRRHHSQSPPPCPYRLLRGRRSQLMPRTPSPTTSSIDGAVVGAWDSRRKIPISPEGDRRKYQERRSVMYETRNKG